MSSQQINVVLCSQLLFFLFLHAEQSCLSASSGLFFIKNRSKSQRGAFQTPAALEADDEARVNICSVARCSSYKPITPRNRLVRPQSPPLSTKQLLTHFPTQIYPAGPGDLTGHPKRTILLLQEPPLSHFGEGGFIRLYFMF